MEPAHQRLLMFPFGNNSAPNNSHHMSSNGKTNERNLLKDEFDALVHKEGAHEDNFERFFDEGIYRRFGELIAGPTWHNPTYGARR